MMCKSLCTAAASASMLAPCSSRPSLWRSRRALPFSDARRSSVRSAPVRAAATSDDEQGSRAALADPATRAVLAATLMFASPCLQPLAARADTVGPAVADAAAAAAVQGSLALRIPPAAAHAERWSGMAAGASADHAQLLYQLADIDKQTAGTIAFVLQPVLSISTLLMIVRIVLSWYPQIDGKKLPWALSVAPTEPILGPTRRLIPPVGGVDVSPIVWVALLSFINEILLGPQGILNLLQRKLDL